MESVGPDNKQQNSAKGIISASAVRKIKLKVTIEEYNNAFTLRIRVGEDFALYICEQDFDTMEEIKESRNLAQDESTRPDIVQQIHTNTFINP